jgi:uncharacterized protein (DUF1697 family)
MARHAAFLRGINLGGRRVSNAELRAAVEGLGFEGVATFRASGNVVFDAPAGDTADGLVARLEAGLAEALGYEVPVFLRSAAEVRRIAAHAPFEAPALEASEGKLQVSLLLRKPPAAAGRAVLAMSTDADRLAIAGRELYWLPSGRMSDSELDLKAVEAALGPTTMRTMGTIEQIAAKHFL